MASRELTIIRTNQVYYFGHKLKLYLDILAPESFSNFWIVNKRGIRVLLLLLLLLMMMLLLLLLLSYAA